MSNQQTDNSAMTDKIDLRIEAIKGLDKISVLDAFHGEGHLWRGVERKIGKRIRVIGIEHEHGKGTGSIWGENSKVIPSLDLSQFNVIDLDAYGIPAEQIELVFANKTLQSGTVIFYTFIPTNRGILPRCMTRRLGYSDRMVEKCPTLFVKEPFLKWCRFLGVFGVTELFDIDLYIKNNTKHYGYFIVPS
jgi:hypothetical protein